MQLVLKVSDAVYHIKDRALDERLLAMNLKVKPLSVEAMSYPKNIGMWAQKVFLLYSDLFAMENIGESEDEEIKSSSLTYMPMLLGELNAVTDYHKAVADDIIEDKFKSVLAKLECRAEQDASFYSIKNDYILLKNAVYKNFYNKFQKVSH